MAITNQSRISSSIANQTKINIGEVWDTNLFTWANESRTWDAMTSIIGNVSRVTSSISNVAKP